MSIETDVQARIADIQSRAAAVTVTASALEQQVANQPPPQTNTITIEVGNSSIVVTASGITITGPVTFSNAVSLPAGSTIDGYVTTTDFNTHTSNNDAHGGHYVPPSGNT